MARTACKGCDWCGELKATGSRFKLNQPSCRVGAGEEKHRLLGR